jgi:hypothetical protein
VTCVFTGAGTSTAARIGPRTNATDNPALPPVRTNPSNSRAVSCTGSNTVALARTASSGASCATIDASRNTTVRNYTGANIAVTGAPDRTGPGTN